MSRRTDKNRMPVRALHAIKSALKREQWAEAKAKAMDAAAARPECAEAHYALAVASIFCDDLATALQAASQAADLVPNSGECEDLLAVIYGLAGDLNNALFHGKAGAEAPRSAHLADLAPKALPSLAQVFLQIEENPLLHRGLVARDKGHWRVAEWWLRQHLVFDPDSREAATGLGASLLADDAPLAAVEVLRAARHRLPHDGAIASQLGRALTCAGASDLARACHAEARRLAPEDGEVAAVAVLDTLMDPRVEQGALAAEYTAWCRTHALPDNGTASLRGGDASGRSLTIGYVVAGFAGSEVAPWVAAILSHRNSSRFTAVGFGHGPFSQGHNRPFQKCFSRWQDLAGADALTMAAMVRGEGIDILVDLVGLAVPGLHAAFGSRMAPCQVAWLGLPAQAAPAAADFILTDRFISCDETTKASPDGARPVILNLGSTLAPPPSAPAIAAEDIEGEGEVLFVADAGLCDLNAVTAEWWSAILHRVPDAKLILRDRGLTQPDALKQVIDIFGTFGVAHRIDVIAEPSPRAFFVHGHVALLPMPCPRPESLSDALSAGIPVVCPAGVHAAGRAAGSMLDHLGLGTETIAADREAYIAMAVRWATDCTARASFPETLADAAARSGIWDPVARARDLEDAFARMWAETLAADESYGVRRLPAVGA